MARRDLQHTIEASIREWNADDAPRLAAALAFYTLLSLSPLVILMVRIAGLTFGDAAAGGQLAWEVHNIVGWDGATVIQAIVRSAHHPHAGALATVLSLLMLVFGASSVVIELREGLNTIWKVGPGPQTSKWRTLWQMSKERFYSFLLITGAGVWLLLTLAASAWVAAVGRMLGSRLTRAEPWMHALAFAVSYVIVVLLFAAIYRVVPEVQLEWGDVMVGAAVTGLIFTLGKQLIALYLGKAALASAYGTAGSFVLLLVWVYYSAQLFLLGAEFTKVYAQRYGSHAPGGRNTAPKPGI